MGDFIFSIKEEMSSQQDKAALLAAINGSV